MSQTKTVTSSLQGKSTTRQIVEILRKEYPQIKTPLHHSSPFQLLIATVLSAQCTDAQVNKVTPKLFAKYPDSTSMSKARQSDLERLVRSTGFFRVKSRRMKEISKKIERDFHGEVPRTMEEMLTLPGVGRKTANIVLSAGYDLSEGIAVDTHVKRLSKRIGLSEERDPDKIERDLMAVTPRDLWPKISMLLILHGRRVCKARAPMCGTCSISALCKYYNSTQT